MTSPEAAPGVSAASEGYGGGDGRGLGGALAAGGQREGQQQRAEQGKRGFFHARSSNHA